MVEIREMSASRANNTRTRVILVDDNPAMRLGVRMLLDAAPTLDVCAEASSAEEALELAEHGCDLILTDLKMPGLTGLDLSRLSKRKWPARPVVVISSFDESQYAEQALERSASAYLMKDYLVDDLLDAIHAALRGQVWLSQAMWQKLLPAELRVVPELSPEQRVVFEALGGIPMPETARAQRGGMSLQAWSLVERELQVLCRLYSPVQLLLLAQWSAAHTPAAVAL